MQKIHLCVAFTSCTQDHCVAFALCFPIQTRRCCVMHESGRAPTSASPCQPLGISRRLEAGSSRTWMGLWSVLVPGPRLCPSSMHVLPYVRSQVHPTPSPSSLPACDDCAKGRQSVDNGGGCPQLGGGRTLQACRSKRRWSSDQSL